MKSNIPHEAKFCYVDTHYQKPGESGTIHTRWRRVHVNKVDSACRTSSNNFNCFSTVLTYCEARHEDNEIAWGPLYFDLDGDVKTDVEVARETARCEAIKIVDFFTQAGQLQKWQVRIWFSGNKGFHIMVDPYALGAAPSFDLHNVYRIIAEWLREHLELTTLDISTIYSSRRMWRLPNSFHHKSGLLKVELTMQELGAGMDAILKLAKTPRDALYSPEDIAVCAEHEPSSVLKEIFDSSVQKWDERNQLRKLRPLRTITALEHAPVCVAGLLTRDSIPVSGTFNRCVMTLAAYCKDANKTLDEAHSLIEGWALGVKNHSNAGKERATRVEVCGVVKAIYDNKTYHFSCAFVRSLGSKDDRVPCEFRQCPVAREDDQRPAEPIAVHLSEASKACYNRATLKINVVISGKDQAPFVIPRKLKVECSPREDARARCRDCQVEPLVKNGPYIHEIAIDEPRLMEFVAISNCQKYLLLRQLINVPQNCRDCRITEEESYNIEDVRLIPQVQDRIGQPTDSDENRWHSHGIPMGNRYVVRRAFYVGHNIRTNMSYQIRARTLPEPRTQYAVHLFHEALASTDDVSSFQMTPQLREDLNIFQVRANQNVWDKFDEIHADLEANVTRIWRRRLVGFAVDLAYHSILNFPFHEQILDRGWIEVFILGDSGQGKTELVTRLIDWYGLGEFITGEDAGRTGLTYSIQQNERRWFLAWGVIPLNDGRLVVIDEFSGLPPEEFEKMSGLRSSGVLRVHKVITAETTARTRLIYMSNPSSGKALGSYEYGTYALKELIPKAEDIRRLDLCLAVKSGEVPPEVINAYELPRVSNVYTSGLCKALVLWTWSRQPQHVHWTEEATKLCLREAQNMAGEFWQDPPLVEPADQRVKIARVSTAAAARVFSTTNGNDLVVKPEHVDFAVRIMRECFSTEGLRYDVYSENMKRANCVTNARARMIEDGWRNLPASRKLAPRMLNLKWVTRTDLEEQLGLSKDDATRIIKFLTGNGLITKSYRGYVKRPYFVEFLHGQMRSGDVDLDDDGKLDGHMF